MEHRVLGLLDKHSSQPLSHTAAPFLKSGKRGSTVPWQAECPAAPCNSLCRCLTPGRDDITYLQLSSLVSMSKAAPDKVLLACDCEYTQSNEGCHFTQQRVP